MTDNSMTDGERLAKIEAAMETAYEQFSTAWPEKLGRFNVMVAGATGTGKSTLVNEIFGCELAAEGVGQPQTMSIDHYRVPGKPVTILDTRGFELGNEEPQKLIDAEIKAMRARPDEADHLHVAWLCLRQDSARFEPYHETFVAKMRTLGVPIVVVLTNSLEDAGNLKTHIASRIEPGVPVIALLARTRRIGPVELPSHSLAELLDATVALLPEGRRTALAAAQVVSVSLKDKQANKVIITAATAAMAAAMLPVPLADLVGVSSVQAGMMAQLDKLAGIDSAGVMRYAKLTGTALARTGSTRLLALVSAQALKLLPGLGTAAGDAIAAGVAGTTTTALGYAYWAAAKIAARSGAQIDAEALGRFYREELGKRQVPTSAAA